MPIITTLSIARSPSPSPSRCRSRRSANHTWATISQVRRLRLNPWCPVEQKRHPTAQPACEDTHSVPRPVSGMNTVSTASPPPTSNSHLTVPSDDTCSARTGRASTTKRPASLSRSDFARSVMRWKSASPARCIHLNNWTARNRFSPMDSHSATIASRSRSSRLDGGSAGCMAGLRAGRPTGATDVAAARWAQRP